MKEQGLIQTFESVSPRRVSYILMTKNRARYLEKAMLLLRNLKKSNDEFIVVDGLSEDDTRDVISAHRDVVDIFISECDLSEGHALNKGILVSRGRYIKQVNDDDVIYADAMERAIQVMEKNPEVDILLCGGTKQRDKQYFTVWLPPGLDYGKRIEDPLRYGGCGVGMVIRKNVFPKVGLMNPKAVALDLDFLTQCISRGASVRFCRINLYHHPIWAHSGTIKRLKEWEADVALIKRRHGIHYPGLIRRLREMFYKSFRQMPTFLQAPLRSGIRVAWRLKQSLLGQYGNGKKKVNPDRSDSLTGKREPIWDAGFS